MKQVGGKYNWEAGLLRIALTKVFPFLASASWQTKSTVGHCILCLRDYWGYHHHPHRSPLLLSLSHRAGTLLLISFQSFHISKFSQLQAYFCTSRGVIIATEIKMYMILVTSERILPCEIATYKCYFAVSWPVSIISNSDKRCLPYCSPFQCSHLCHSS